MEQSTNYGFLCRRFRSGAICIDLAFVCVRFILYFLSKMMALCMFQAGRRRSRDGQTQLRSPLVQRPLAAKVTLQGWLHKQGSEGLMLWKRRWFVLSDFCLFYYKGKRYLYQTKNSTRSIKYSVVYL
jgi:hypothetical protein